VPKVRSGNEGEPVMAELEEHMEGEPEPGADSEPEPEDLNWHAGEDDDDA
jgi:hypothetical protein